MRMIICNESNERKKAVRENAIKIIAGILAVLTLITTFGCAKNNVNTPVESTSIENNDDTKTYVDEGNTYEEITNDFTDTSSTSAFNDTDDFFVLTKNKKPNTNVFFGDRVSYYEYNNEVLNDAIKKIKAIKFSGSFDAAKYIREELASIQESEYFSMEKEVYDTDYSWYINETIDTDKLYDRIIRNNIKNFIIINSTVNKLVKTTANAIARAYEYITINFPEYDCNMMLHSADCLTVKEDDIEGVYSVYNGFNNSIVYNMDNIGSDEELLVAACHEAYHMSFNRNYITDDAPVYHEGASLDSATNINSALSIDTFSERFNDGMAYESMGKVDNIDYPEANETIKFLSASTGKDPLYFRNAFVFGSQNDLISVFEPEFQDFETAYSFYCYANVCCGTPVYEEITVDDDFKLEGFEKFRTLCLQNGCVRMIKEYMSGKITYPELTEEYSDFVQILAWPEYNYDSDNVEFFDNLAILSNIIESLER